VLEPVRRRDQFVQRESATGLLRDRVADVGVGVDERGQHDIGRVGRGRLDPRDLPVLDDDVTLDGVERLALEDRSLERSGHTWAWRCGAMNATARGEPEARPRLTGRTCPIRSVSSSTKTVLDGRGDGSDVLDRLEQ
jgi:hypothetical protein